MEAMKRLYVNGGVLFCPFTVQGELERDFILSDQAVPELTNIKPVSLGPSKSIDSLTDHLARIIFDGGAYTRTLFSFEQALDLASSLVEAIIRKRAADFCYWELGSHWSGWFFNIAWDYSFLVFDKGEKVVTLICMTDTD